MAIEKDLEFEDTPNLSKRTKKGTGFISEASTWKLQHEVLHRLRYPISVTLNVIVIGAVAWDKIHSLFF